MVVTLGPQYNVGEKLLLFLAFSVLVANQEKTTLHFGQSRSWSVEQGENKIKKRLSAPPTPRCSFEKNEIKTT